MNYQIDERNLERQKVLAESTNFLARKYLSKLDLKPDAKVLDLGCGLGYTSRELANTLNASQITGVDLDERLIKNARQINGDGVDFKVANATALPFDENSFDFVYCRFLLLHVPAYEAVMAEMHRVVKTGGMIMIQDFDLLTSSGLYPPESAYDLMSKAMNELYANPQIGRKLPSLFRTNGMEPNVRSDVFLVANKGVSKTLMTLTAEGMVPAMVNAGLMDKRDEQELLEQMQRIEKEEKYELMNNPIITVWAKK